MSVKPAIKINRISITNVHHHHGVNLDAITGQISDFEPGFIAPEIGTWWGEQGGVVAGIMPKEGVHPAYYLIVPTGAAIEDKSLEWGGYDENSQATSDWDGLANTRALVESDADHPAAQFCHDLKIDGFSDFYLPSRREASLMTATVPTLFKDGWHWTSTQYSADNAFIQAFSGGDQLNVRKGSESRVRAVRRFLIN